MRNRRSLLVVADSLDGGLGAIARVHARWFSDRGWEVTVAAPRAGDDVTGKTEVVPLPSSTRDLPAMARAARRLRRLRRTTRPDVVHCHGLRSFAATRLSGSRPFVTVHGAGIVPSDPTGYDAVRRLVRSAIPRLAVRAISAAPDVAGWEFMAHASPRLATLQRMPFPPEDETPLFLWVGRVDEGKPGDEFVRALASVSERHEVRGIVAGGGDGIDRMAALAEQSKAPIEFAGQVDPEPLFAGCTALCLFSTHEAVSFVVQEAMWCGRSVVASDLPGIRWVVGDAGALVSDETTAISAMDSLCERRPAAEMGERAAERIRAVLHPDDPWPAVERLYEEHLGDS